MKHQRTANQQYQSGVREARTHIDAQKSRGTHPPRTVGEEVREMLTEPDEHGVRRRDPLKAAKAQSQPHRD